MEFNTGTGAGLTVANHGAYAMVHPLHEAEQSGFDVADVHSVGDNNLQVASLLDIMSLICGITI